MSNNKQTTSIIFKRHAKLHASGYQTSERAGLRGEVRRRFLNELKCHTVCKLLTSLKAIARAIRGEP